MDESQSATSHKNAKKRKIRKHVTVNTNQSSVKSKKTPVNQIKKRIRDIERLLNHAQKLPAQVRVSHERELAQLQRERRDAERKALRNEMIGKYHMVRFFERKKATRFLKQARAQLADAHEEEDRKRSEQEIHALEVDLNYTTHCPLDQKYLSLYSKHEDDDGTERYVPNRAQPMWKQVEAAMRSGTLDELRNGSHTRDKESKDGGETVPTRKPPPVKAKVAKARPVGDTTDYVHPDRRLPAHGKVIPEDDGDPGDGEAFFE